MNDKLLLRSHYVDKHGGKRFFCDICEYGATSKAIVMSHKKDKHESSTTDCNFCDFQGISHSNLEDHKQTAHVGSIFSCDQCTYESKSEAMLAGHKRLEHGDLFYCDKCKFKTTSTVTLKNHILAKHQLDSWMASQGIKSVETPRQKSKLTKENVEILNCGQCSFQTNHLRSLEDHRLIHELKNKLQEEVDYHQAGVKCSNCTFIATDKDSVEKHYRETHSCKCVECSYETKFIDELKVHIIEEHRGNYCELCFIQVLSYEELLNHNKSIHGGIPFPCEKCGYCAPSQINLLAHIEIAHDYELDENVDCELDENVELSDE